MSLSEANNDLNTDENDSGDKINELGKADIDDLQDDEFIEVNVLNQIQNGSLEAQLQVDNLMSKFEVVDPAQIAKEVLNEVMSDQYSAYIMKTLTLQDACSAMYSELSALIEEYERSDSRIRSKVESCLEETKNCHAIEDDLKDHSMEIINIRDRARWHIRKVLTGCNDVICQLSKIDNLLRCLKRDEEAKEKEKLLKGISYWAGVLTGVIKYSTQFSLVSILKSDKLSVEGSVTAAKALLSTYWDQVKEVIGTTLRVIKKVQQEIEQLKEPIKLVQGDSNRIRGIKHRTRGASLRNDLNHNSEVIISMRQHVNQVEGQSILINGLRSGLDDD
jgi:hypothetical protein